MIAVPTSSLTGRFRSKKDIFDYLQKHRKNFISSSSNFLVGNYYLPPIDTINKDFLKAVLADEKVLFKADKVKMVTVPQYDELSLKALLPFARQKEDINRGLPDDNMCRHKNIDRTYFFNILNTLRSEYLAEVTAEANKKRFKPVTEEGVLDQIKMT